MSEKKRARLREWVEEGLLNFDEKGRLVLGVPSIIIPRVDLAELQKSMEEIIGESGAAAITYKAGFKHGYRHAKMYAELFGLEGLDIIRRHLSVVSTTGWWGKHEIVEFSEEPLRLVVRFYSSLAEEWAGAGRPVCHVWRGALAGMMTFLAESRGRKVQLRSREVKCIAKGDPYCEIVVEEFRS